MGDELIPNSYFAAYQLLKSALSDSGPSINEISDRLEGLVEETLSQMKVSQNCVEFVRRTWQETSALGQTFADDYFRSSLPTEEFESYFDPSAQPQFEAEVLSCAVREHLIHVMDKVVHGYDRGANLEYFIWITWSSFISMLQDSMFARYMQGHVWQYQREGRAEETKKLIDWIRDYRTQFDTEAFASELATLCYLEWFVMVERW